MWDRRDDGFAVLQCVVRRAHVHRLSPASGLKVHSFQVSELLTRFGMRMAFNLVELRA